MKNICLEEKCTGCGVCAALCPQNAICMEEDSEGFLRPEILQEKCIDCKICAAACEKNRNLSSYERLQRQEYYAARSKDNEVLRSSTSGGVFTVLTDWILEQDGVVYGAAFDEGFVVSHRGAKTQEERNRFRGSKYVQSSMIGIYEQVASDLSCGKTVLFSGTPCQNAAMQTYLSQKKINTERYYSCDMVCHGVSSPRIWREYIEYLQHKYQRRLDHIAFRCKDYGWSDKRMKVIMEQEDFSEACNKGNSYLCVFLSMVAVRKSCFSCDYTSYDRTADITLADFWNVGKHVERFDDDKGVSTLVVNTEKGKALFAAVSAKLDKAAVSKEAVWQPHFEYSDACPRDRDSFWKNYHEQGIDFVMKRYGKGNFMSRLKKAATPILKKTGLYVPAGRLYRKIIVRK